MNILVIGSGGREHALCWKIQQSLKVKKIFCAPGNGGIAGLAECVNIKADDIVGLLNFARDKKIDLTVVGPEVPLVLGVVDAFEKAGVKIFGPSKAAAQLEGSKVFSKDFMRRHHVPTAAYRSFDTYEAALAGLKKFTLPVVVKADGLAAGKGVIICNTLPEATDALKTIMQDRAFKDAGLRVVVEEFLVGEEASILAVADGKDFILLDSSQDHKRIFDNDEGPNTGGMGAYSPAPVVTAALWDEIGRLVIKPVIDGMAQEGAPFKGILYAGIMVTAQGPKVLEFNTRFGDPETQAVLPRLKTDIIDVMLAAVEGRLREVTLEWDPRACVCVVIAAGGYPGDYASGKEIRGLDAVSAPAFVFHAGTKKDGEKILTSGGRVLGVTALGMGVAEAIGKVYAAVEKVSFEGAQYRRDIGKKALNR
ncbi:MAG: phosphoribosylamine--glycine ligase [Candidatus Omnitrophica bacterium]|nr:phosphoribosylamine--glycine ligase [Candidatus Omnitrophota bacterium]